MMHDGTGLWSQRQSEYMHAGTGLWSQRQASSTAFNKLDVSDFSLCTYCVHD